MLQIMFLVYMIFITKNNLAVPNKFITFVKNMNMEDKIISSDELTETV